MTEDISEPIGPIIPVYRSVMRIHDLDHGDHFSDDTVQVYSLDPFTESVTKNLSNYELWTVGQDVPEFTVIVPRSTIVFRRDSEYPLLQLNPNERYPWWSPERLVLYAAARRYGLMLSFNDTPPKGVDFSALPEHPADRQAERPEMPTQVEAPKIRAAPKRIPVPKTGPALKFSNKEQPV